MRKAHLRILAAALAGVLALAGVVVGLSRSGSAAGGGRGLQVVAAENFWGSIAAQLGGDRVHTASLIASPATDPHDYEPTAADARTMAGARLAIVNGVGYDPWATKLIAANPVHGRVVLTVGDVLGVPAGGNPHRWYSPADVRKVIDVIVRDYSQLDPKGSRYFARRKARFETHELAEYDRLLATIKRRYHGVAVGASESVVEPLAQALGLDLLTPSSFLKAISEGADPTASDRAAIDRQIATRRIKVWVLNKQNSTPDVQRITAAAHKRGIPVVTITETLTPATASFQAWQARQLNALAAALARATGT